VVVEGRLRVQAVRRAAGLMALVVSLAFGWLIWILARRSEPTGGQIVRGLMTVISIPILLLWFHNRERVSQRLQNLALAIVLVIILAFVACMALVVYQNLIHPPQWDFLVFWLDGHVGVQGVNFYVPARYQGVGLPISTDGGFAAPVLDVGFRYPPLSMLLFLPLGLLDIGPAMALWYVVNGLALGATIWLLWRTFFGNEGRAGLVMAIALVAVVGGTLSTLKFGQTNFLALLLLVLAWRDRDRPSASFWIVLAGYVKPFLFILLMYPVLRRNFRGALVAAATLIGTSVLSIAVFGRETFMAFFLDSPVGRLPYTEYLQEANQSLLSTVLGLAGYDVSQGAPLIHPLYIIASIALVGITSWLVIRVKDEDAYWGPVLLLMLGLLVYPASFFLYSTFLVLPLILLWTNRLAVPGGPWGSGVLVTAVYVLTVFAGCVFAANLLLWVALAGVAAWSILGAESTGSGLMSTPNVGLERVIGGADFRERGAVEVKSR
jgi:hypothetical protein